MSAPGAEWISDRSREHSPEEHDGHDGSPGKRASKKRKVLSCYACRNRKMKCDRVYPVCGRCQRTGRADQCTYDPRMLEESHQYGGAQVEGVTVGAVMNTTENINSPHTGSDALQWKVRIQERRIERLERKLAAHTVHRNPSQYDDIAPEEPDIKEEMMFRGKGFKTQFHGVTSVMSMIARYRELQAFTREALTVDHSIMRVKSDFKTFRDRRKINTRMTGSRIKGTDEEVFAALPEQHIIAPHVALYIQTWETTYRILHEPSFWNEYHGFWDQQPGDSGHVGFAVLLILIVATAKCLTPKDDVFIGDTTSNRQDASNLIELCDSWISRQPRKRLTLSFFQLQCLLLLAKRVNCIQLKQDWVLAGDLVRLALASGMHRDPALLVNGRISEFEKEMKKRLWITIMELELQSSLESGLQSSLTGLYFDTPSPSNLPDDTFASDTQHMTASWSIEQFTPTSYLALASKTLPLRIHLTQLLNNPTSDVQYSDIMSFDAQIHSALSAIPKWEDESAVLPYALLQLQLYQYLLILHKPYAKLAPLNQRYTYSFTAIVETSSSMTATHDNLLSKGILALNNFRNDVVRVGLTLSQIVYSNCIRHPIKSSAPPSKTTESHFADLPPPMGSAAQDTVLSLAVLPQEPFLTRTLCASSLDILERSRQIYEQKVMRLGTGYMEVWLLSAAVGMLPAVPSPATSIAFVTHASDDILSRCKKTLDHFTTLAFRVLALQKDPENSFALSLGSTMASVSPSDPRTPSVSNAPGGSMGSGTNPLSGGVASFVAMPGLNVGMIPDDAPRDMNGPFDALQDMQVDMGGWSFPDFWAFDLSGEF